MAHSRSRKEVVEAIRTRYKALLHNAPVAAGCVLNDVYREAEKLEIGVEGVQVKHWADTTPVLGDPPASNTPSTSPLQPLALGLKDCSLRTRARNGHAVDMRRQQAIWRIVLRLIVVVSAISSLVVLAGGTALWFLERGLPDRTIRSYGDALWWALTTLTTVGYGDHVPVTAAGRLVAAVVMVLGVAVIGAVAAIVALAVALRVAQEEERVIDAEAERFEKLIEARLDRIEAQLSGLAALLDPESPAVTGTAHRPGRDEEQR